MRFLSLMILLCCWQISLAQDSAIGGQVSGQKIYIADSVEKQLPALDSLNKANPITKISNRVDSIKSVGQSKIDAIDGKLKSIQNLPQNIIDSLDQKVKSAVDPLTGKIANKIEVGSGKIDALQSKLNEKVGENLKISEELGAPTSDVSQQFSDVNKTVDNLTPDLDFKNPDLKPELPVPGSDGSKLNSNLPQLNLGIDKKIGSVDLDKKINLSEVKVPGGDGLESVTNELNKVKEIKTEASQYLEGVKEVKQSGLRSYDTKELEQRTFEAVGGGEMDAKLKDFTKVKLEQDQLLQKFSDKKLVEAELKRKMKNVMNDELSSFSPQVKKAQARMAQLQKIKSDTVALNEVKKRQPNQMKDLPLRSRLDPGLAFQVFNGNEFFLDLAPQVGYRLAGRLTSGIGIQYRVAINKRYDFFIQDAEVFGGRVYVDFKAVKSFYLHAEFETLKLGERALPPSLEDPKYFVYSSHFGVGKKFNLSKRISATMFGFYRLEYSGHISGFSKYNARLVLGWRSKKKDTSESK